MSNLALVVRGLTRRFGGREAVKDLNLTVREGDIYGFLGPNGAGKTTAMRCMLGLIRRDAGNVQIFGRDGLAARQDVGAIIEAPSFHSWLSGRENLRLACAYAGISPSKVGAELDRVLERVGLLHRGNDSAGTYSHGMKQRLGIARALLGQPRLLMLDEPTNGLDPSGMREVRELIRALALHDRITVFISSHLLAEVQAICNRVAILSEGVLQTEGDVRTLLSGDGSPQRIVEIGSPSSQKLESTLEQVSGVTIEGPGADGRLRLHLQGLEISQLVEQLVKHGVPVESVVPEKRNLEDVFLEVTSGSPQ